MDYLTLDVNGVILAFVLAFIMLFIATFSTINTASGWYLGLFYVIIMLYFLALSAVVTRVGKHYKLSIRQYQQTRGVKNVLANGLGPLIFVVIVLVIGGISSGSTSTFFVVGFIASVAAVTSDKFSSEIGVLNGAPVSIITMKRIKKGESGGVTFLGLGAGFVAAILISVFGVVLFFILLPSISPPCPTICSFSSPPQLNYAAYLAPLMLAATLGGFIGTLVDSILGHFEEKGIGNKYTSNFLCSIAGGLAALLIFFLIM